ncbi:MaoC domain-containing protein dehydratase [Halosimplex carlsbadense 2-9-1]|uniref:MaoC domain-containing protein dehydratase n=1 Tax=Halosimplex carlsbadense 2-9-1 TaxID=797114 RepID=M0CE69_9EURY|nr:MaoC family dehydratase [Halosimplex carlsbadense]ELZ20662.1 MaoC domain-containing protein dehydratase [Halosimplex carlsbadense 2-9-1]
MEYFEDVTVGDTDAFGSYGATASEITDFAERYDPQPFHTDPEAAADSPFGGLVASGWHTAAMTMRLLVDEFLADGATRGALGVDELRWRRPVRPGDELTVTTEIVDKEGWDDELGVVSVRITTEADGEEALTMVGLVLYERRTAP